MKVLFVVLFALFACIPVFAQSNSEMIDVVYLKDGSVVRGTIVEMEPNISLTIETVRGLSFYFSMDEISKIAKERQLQTQTTAEEVYMSERNRQNITQPQTETLIREVYVSRKEPGLAWLFSFLFPGGGQFYNRDIAKGVVMTTIGLGTYVGIIAVSSSYYYDDSYNSSGAVIALCCIGLANSLWSMIDAPIRSNAINRANGLAAIKVGKNVTLSLSPDLNISAYGNSELIPSYGAKLALRFH